MRGDALGDDRGGCNGAQVTGSLVREIRPEVRTKGKLTARGNDRGLRYERERKRERAPLSCFFRASNLPLVNMFVKERQGGRRKRRRVSGGWRREKINGRGRNTLLR